MDHPDPYEQLDYATDEDLLAEVTGLGEVRTPSAAEVLAAAELDVAGQPDLRGDRDWDENARSPWSAP